jgi:hypothetical protein
MSSFPSVVEQPQVRADSFEERFRQAMEDMRRGHPVILVDDFDRENEGDLIVPPKRSPLQAWPC